MQLSRCGYVSSFGRRKRQASEGGGMTRSPRATITVPSDALNDSAHCLLENVGAFSHLPDTLCTGEGDDNCWNGRQLGRYFLKKLLLLFTKTEVLRQMLLLLLFQCPLFLSLVTPAAWLGLVAGCKGTTPRCLSARSSCQSFPERLVSFAT